MLNRFEKDLKNLDLPFTMDVGSGSSTLLITFAGISGALGVYPFEFFKITKGFDVDKIFIRDVNQAWYHKGLNGIGNNIEEIADYFKKLIEKYNYNKVVCLGNSMGGYAALVIGKLIDADIILSFAPQTFLDSKNRELHRDNRWIEQIAQLPTTIEPKYLDLSLLFDSKTNNSLIHIFYSLDERIDIVHANWLKDTANVTLHVYENGGHQLVQHLRKSGELYRILRNNLIDFSGDRIIATFMDLENGYTLEDSLKRHDISKEVFEEYSLNYKTLSNFQGFILHDFFESIKNYIEFKTHFEIVNVQNKSLYSMDYCIDWFSQNKLKKQMFGIYIDFHHPLYLLHIEVGTKNLHIGFTKYKKENNLFYIIPMHFNDFETIQRYNKYLNSHIKLENRNWGNIWCSIDCGDYSDLSHRETFLSLTNFEDGKFYKTIFSHLIDKITFDERMNNMYKKYIFTPGPVKMAEDILALGAMQTPYFRNSEFSEVLLECENNLLKIVNAPEGSRVLFLTASGTAGMESTVQNLLNQDDKALVINGGTFGQRFAEICEIHKIEHVNFKITENNLSDTTNLQQHKDTTALLINAHETSIGLLYDLKSVGEFCKENNILNIVDAISMFVTDELDMQQHHIDALIVSSHKGLALPPGLSMVVLSPRAIQKVNPKHQLYFDFNSYLSDGQRGQTPFTPAITIILQLQARLRQIVANGIEAEINKAKEIASYFRESIKTLPLKAYSLHMPNGLTTLTPTDDKSASTIVKDLEEKYNVVVAPNGGALKDKIFRVSHMGAMTKEYTDILIDVLFNYYGRQR